MCSSRRATTRGSVRSSRESTGSTSLRAAARVLRPADVRPCWDQSGSVSLPARACSGPTAVTWSRPSHRWGSQHADAQQLCLDRSDGPGQPVDARLNEAGPMAADQPLHRRLDDPAGRSLADRCRSLRALSGRQWRGRHQGLRNRSTCRRPHPRDSATCRYQDQDAGASLSGSRTRRATRTGSAASPLVAIGFDEQPPSLAFAEGSVDDPTRVRVASQDVTSGLAEAQIEVRRQGEDVWRPLADDVGPVGLLRRTR